MDARTFDRFTVSLTHRPTRRAAVRLLASGLLGVLVSRQAVTAVAAQRADSDGDGLFDDDEVEVYGTDPNNPDTDGDGISDGEEIYNRDNGLGGSSDPLTPGGATCADGLTLCAGMCVDLANDPANCGACGVVCPNGGACPGGFCSAGQAPPQPTNCGGLGAACNVNADCCSGGAGVACCFSGVTLSTICTDISATGTGLCPGESPAPTACPVGQSLCTITTTFCTDLASDPFNCGACAHSCGLGGVCSGGVCSPAPPPPLTCPQGQTDCGVGFCVDLNTDTDHCGGCEFGCFAGDDCENGQCV